MLYISNVDLSFLSNGEQLGQTALPGTTKAAMNAVPFVFTGMLGVMAGLNWVIGRRMKLANEKPRRRTDMSRVHRLKLILWIITG